jgi:SAM-dependent methyltransferase
MAINAFTGALLIEARLHGVDLGDVVTIGRQALRIPQAELAEHAEKLGVSGPMAWQGVGQDGYAEDFLIRLLGAKSVASLDFSDYEGATLVHDMNRPLPVELHGRFDCVIDGGSLEHIFDIRQALINEMALLRVGGHLFVVTPANNMCGHGFYQFSPEFFYRVFDAANGFAVERLLIVETPLLSVSPSRNWRLFRLAEPAKQTRRIKLVNSKPLLLFVQARKTVDVAPFVEPPQQADYRSRWDEHHSPTAQNDDRGVAPFRYASRVDELRRRLRQRRKNSLTNRRYFEPVS